MGDLSPDRRLTEVAVMNKEGEKRHERRYEELQILVTEQIQKAKEKDDYQVTHSFISKNVLRTHHVPDTVLGSWKTAGNQSPALLDFRYSLGDTDNPQIGTRGYVR